jgi:hypothetical protein
MADRYQDRRFPSGNFSHGGDQRGAEPDDSDPLAELARLIGQTEPFGNAARANPPPRAIPRQRHQPQYETPSAEEEPAPPPGPPPWMRRANARVIQREAETEIPPEQEYPASVHPVHRYARPAVPDDQYREEEQHTEEEPAYEQTEQQADPARYDEALYDQIDTGVHDYQREPAYPDDPYAYQDGYDEEHDRRTAGRRGKVLTVIAVLTLAVVGTGAAFAYRTYFGLVRSTEPPIIRADNSPTKIVPAPGDNIAKAPDRMPSADGTEKIVSREETPIDVNRSGAPRIVFPTLKQNANPPSPPSVSTSTMPAADSASGAVPTNGTMPSNEPHKIKTFAVRGDQPDSAAAPVGVSPPAPPPKPTAAPKAAAAATRAVTPAAANAPLSLAPDASSPPAPAAEAHSRVATTTPNSTPPAAPASGGYLVQVSSQRSETDAQASFKTLQGKFPSVLGSQTPLIKRADLGDKGVYYRAMVGPFGTPEEAAQFCGSLKSAGGQCVVQKN